MSGSVQSLQSQLKILESAATSPLDLLPLARQLLELARKSAALPLPELQASLMLLASDALSKFDDSTGPATLPAQQPSAVEAPPPTAPATETTSPVVPPQRPTVLAAAPVIPVAEPRTAETPPQGGSTEKAEEEPQAG